MPISKFDIYKQEWIELVFEKRNKSYGAYDLRKHYATNLLKAMAITALAFTGVFIGALLLSKHPADAATHPLVSEVDLSKKFIVIYPEQIKAQNHKAVQTVSHKTFSNKSDIIVSNGNSSLKYIKVIDVNTAGAERHNSPGVTIHEENVNEPIDVHGLDVMPEPLGGIEGWARFLQKNIQYPAMAKVNKISGKVWLSFIIESDGHISNIIVERPAGNGFDEEATRVLKLASAWTPGIKNGQNARVKYTLPINFHIDG